MRWMEGRLRARRLLGMEGMEKEKEHGELTLGENGGPGAPSTVQRRSNVDVGASGSPFPPPWGEPRPGSLDSLCPASGVAIPFGLAPDSCCPLFPPTPSRAPVVDHGRFDHPAY